MFSSRRAPAYARRRSDDGRIVQSAGVAEAARLRRPLLHRRHRRTGRQRQDRTAAGAVPHAARSLSAGGRHKRHLHEGGCRVPDAPRRAAVRAHPRRRDRRLPAHRHSRRHQPESGRARRADGVAPSRSCCSSRAAATTSPRSSAAISPITRSTSSTCRAATRFRAKGARALRSPICSSSTKRISRRSSGADLGVMERDARKMRGDGPFLFTQVKNDVGSRARSFHT